jgi:hypothetical protein
VPHRIVCVITLEKLRALTEEMRGTIGLPGAPRGSHGGRQLRAQFGLML